MEGLNMSQTWMDTMDPARLATAMTDVSTRPAGREYMDYARGDAKFAVWLALVDRRVMRRAGVGLFDLADWCMRDAYDQGFSPAEGCEEALASDDTFSALVD